MLTCQMGNQPTVVSWLAYHFFQNYRTMYTYSAIPQVSTVRLQTYNTKQDKTHKSIVCHVLLKLNFFNSHVQFNPGAPLILNVSIPSYPKCPHRTATFTSWHISFWSRQVWLPTRYFGLYSIHSHQPSSQRFCSRIFYGPDSLHVP